MSDESVKGPITIVKQVGAFVHEGDVYTLWSDDSATKVGPVEEIVEDAEEE